MSRVAVVGAGPAGLSAAYRLVQRGFDVDVIDFTDTPLSENPGRNEGVAYDDAMRALAVLLGASSFAGLTVTELNPDHAEEGAGSIERLARDLARALAAG